VTSFFYVVPIAFHTSVPALRKCMNTSRKKNLLAESAATRAPGRGQSVTELMTFMNFLVHSHTYCSDRHASPHWTFIYRWISMGFTPLLLKKPMTDAVLLWCMLQARPPSLHYYCTVMLHCASSCHLSATLQTMSIIVLNLQDNRDVFRIFIVLLRFSFDSPS